MSLASSLEGRRAAVLAVARVFMGLLFLSVWSYNLQKGYYWTSGYADFVSAYAADTHTPGMAAMLNHVVIPNAAFFSKLQMVTELALIGVPLTIGLLTPVSGAIGVVFALNLGLAANGKPHEWTGTYAMIFLLLAMAALTQAGRTWGIDARLVRRNPHPRLPIY
jgi:hypothetical protein